MAKEYPRRVRVGEEIHRVLADLIRRELRDPRLGMVTIASVDVSPDLRQAKVYFTVLGDDTRVRDSELALKRSAGFLRHELGQRLRLRLLPQLNFLYDATERQATRLEALLAVEKHRPDSSGADEKS